MTTLQITMPFAFPNTADSAVQSGKRDVRDFYPTPAALVWSALRLIDRQPQHVLDPCAGRGVWGSVAREMWPNAVIVGVDMHFDEPHQDYDAWFNQDFRAYRPVVYADLVMMNPPFSLAQEFIEYGRAHLADNGRLIALVKINLLCGQDRALNFWPHYKPISIHTLGRRPSFSGDGRTGVAEEYMLVMWGRESAETTQLEIGRMW